MRYDQSSFDVEKVLTSPEIKAIITERAVKVANSAAANAPVKTGDFRNSIHVEYDEHGGHRHDRFTATVIAARLNRATGNSFAGSDHGAAVEFGNSRERGHHTLRGALESLE